MSTKEERRETLQNTIDDHVSNLLYYDRKEDEDLPMGTIEEMVEKKEVTVDEMIEWFAVPLRTHFRKR